MKLICQGNYIVLELIEQNYGGIALPANSGLEKLSFWRIAEVGPGKTLDNGDLLPMKLKVGQEVSFDPRMRGVKLEPTYMYDDRKLLVVNADSIMFTVEDRGEMKPMPRILSGKELQLAS